MTLVELLAVIAIQATVLGSVTALLCFTLAQVGQNSAALASLNQANAVMDAISNTVQEAYSCSVPSKNGINGLRCKMPGTASDSDADGVNDVFNPEKFDSGGKPSYPSGQRIWYYLADATGTFGTTGATLWRAVRTDDSDPTAIDADRAWSLYYLSGSRYPLVNSVEFAVNSSNQITTVTLTASATQYAPHRLGEGTVASDVQSVTLRETLPWRTDFE